MSASKTSFAAVLAVVAIAGGTAFYHPWQLSVGKTVAAQSHSGPLPVLVTVTRPAPATTANVVLPATLRPWQTTALHARVSGYLTAWHRDLGSPVKVGDLLAEI